MQEFSLIEKIVIWAIPIIFAITVHEVAHGWVASKLGDQTAKMLGRLTLNPVKHIDPIGTVLVPVMMLVFTPYAFGWAKPVPVDWRNLRQPKRDMAWVAIAGPAANLIMLVLWAIMAKIVFLSGDMYPGIAKVLYTMCSAGVLINAILMILNLIPVPPLDGSRVLTAFLSPMWAYRFNQLERYGLIIIALLLVSGLLGRIMQPLVLIVLQFVDYIIGV